MITRYCTQVVAVLSLHTAGHKYSRASSIVIVDVPCWVKEQAIIFGWKAAGRAGAETFAEVCMCQEYRSQMQADSVHPR